MKKFIITISIVVAGLVLYVVQEPINEIRAERGIEQIFSDDFFDYTKEEFTVHAIGLDHHSFTIRIEKPQYKEQAEEYFRDFFDSNGMAGYKIDIYVGIEQPLTGDYSDYSVKLSNEEKLQHYRQYIQIVNEINARYQVSMEVVPLSEFQPADWVPPIVFRQRAIERTNWNSQVQTPK